MTPEHSQRIRQILIRVEPMFDNLHFDPRFSDFATAHHVGMGTFSRRPRR